MQRITAYRSGNGGFTLVEMMVVVAIITILAAMLLPALSRAKDQANRISCINNLKQLDYAAHMYVDDNEDQLPPRRDAPNHWVSRLKEYYVADKIVECPKGHMNEVTPHSYLINAFNDYFKRTLSDAEFDVYMNHLWPYGMRMSVIPEPSDTILFGEKLATSHHVHMDVFQGVSGNDLDEVDNARHLTGPSKASGASDYAFIDGSVRTIHYGAALNPVNMWAVEEDIRRQPTDPEDK